MSGSAYHTFSRPEISRLFKQARRIYKSRELDVLSAPRTREYGRLLIITPKKIGNAPQRNKVKRRLRAVFYENRLFESNRDLVAIIKKDGVSLPFEKLQKIITQCASATRPECRTPVVQRA